MMYYAFLFLILCAVALGGAACEEMVILDGKPVPKSTLKNVEAVVSIVVYDDTGCAPCIELKKNLDYLGVPYTPKNAKGVASITDVPTCIIFVDGKETFRFVGSQPIEYLRRIFNK